MIRSGLKDDSLDLSQIWRQIFTLANATPAPLSDTVEAKGNCKMCAFRIIRAYHPSITYLNESEIYYIKF